MEAMVMAMDTATAGSRRSHLTNRRPRAADRAPVAPGYSLESSHFFDGHASNKVLKLVWNLCVIMCFFWEKGKSPCQGVFKLPLLSYFGLVIVRSHRRNVVCKYTKKKVGHLSWNKILLNLSFLIFVSYYFWKIFNF